MGRNLAALDDRFCETCGLIVEEVHAEVLKAVDKVRHAVTAGESCIQENHMDFLNEFLS